MLVRRPDNIWIWRRDCHDYHSNVLRRDGPQAHERPTWLSIPRLFHPRGLYKLLGYLWCYEIGTFHQAMAHPCRPSIAVRWASWVGYAVHKRVHEMVGEGRAPRRCVEVIDLGPWRSLRPRNPSGNERDQCWYCGRGAVDTRRHLEGVRFACKQMAYHSRHHTANRRPIDWYVITGHQEVLSLLILNDTLR